VPSIRERRSTTKMATASKPNRAVFLAMEELGLTGWLPGSGRRLAVRNAREALTAGESTRVPVQTSSRAAMRQTSEAALRSSRSTEASRTMAWLVVTAIGAVTAVALASLFSRRR
jgi:hypothetical protein